LRSEPVGCRRYYRFPLGQGAYQAGIHGLAKRVRERLNEREGGLKKPHKPRVSPPKQHAVEANQVLREQLGNADERAAEFEERSKELQEELVSSQEALRKSGWRVTELEGELTTLQDRCKELEAEVASLRAELGKTPKPEAKPKSRAAKKRPAAGDEVDITHLILPPKGLAFPPRIRRLSPNNPPSASRARRGRRL
jgi:hypothetical protein